MSAGPVADQLAKARADLAAATTAAKLATAKRARLAAEVRALEAEAEIEAMRIQARADRERAEAAEARVVALEATLEQERAEHLLEERAHAAETERFKRTAARKATNGRKDTGLGPTAAEPMTAPATLPPHDEAEPVPMCVQGNGATYSRRSSSG